MFLSYDNWWLLVLESSLDTGLADFGYVLVLTRLYAAVICIGDLLDQGFPTLCPRLPWRPSCLLLEREKSSKHTKTKRIYLPTR